MNPSQLSSFLKFSIENKFPVLIKGRPGIGKSDIVTQSAEESGADIIISHPVVSDPTDYKGLPFPGNDGVAHFMPFGDLQKLIVADKPTVFFMDDLGQAPVSVQAAAMQLILARQINGHKISDQVTFIGATNRREDKAGVSGILEPVKSRFASIVELNTDLNDWVYWALTHNMPTELISFIKFKPEMLSQHNPSKDIENSPSPRTIAYVGKMQNKFPESFHNDVIASEIFRGAAGEAFSAEYCAFLKHWRSLPNIDALILAPDSTPVPQDPAVKYAITGALSARLNVQTIEPILRYMERMDAEFSVSMMKDAITLEKRAGKSDLATTRCFVEWSVKYAHMFTFSK